MSDRAIWKFPLASQETKVEMPVGARVLTVQVQAGKPCLWALVDPAELTETRTFVAIGTGWPFAYNDRAPYLGTVQIGLLVWHLFEVSR